MSAPPEFPAGTPVGVLIPRPPGHWLDYLAPEGGCSAGDLVEVPLGPSRALGCVWGPAEGGLAPARLRPAGRVLEAPPLSAELRGFLMRAADYTLTAPGLMLYLATRAPGLADGPASRRVFLPSGTVPERMTPARARVLAVFAAHGGAPLGLAEIARAAAVSAGVVQGLAAQGALVEAAAPRDGPYPRLDPDRAPPALSADQAAAAARLGAVQGFGVTLLKGVTGSGKTEVYLEAVASCLRAGRQALVLLPEIGLTEGFLARVEARFGARPAEWHSGIPQAERRRLWRMAAEGGLQLAVGARSALFLPFRDLGLVVVDEEHDASYKQEEGVIYHARDMAVLRAQGAGAAVVLASATPSLETWVNARAGRYRRADLPARYGAATLPEMRAVDLRAEAPPAGHWVSDSLRAAVAERLANGEQSLLFLNRRGYAPVTLCRACGHQVHCHQCDARMVEHRFLNRLQCHQCGFSTEIPNVCPSCGVEGRMHALGPGVERLEEEVRGLFPQARVAVLSSDLFASARALKAQIEAIAAGEADLVIGTQLVAKGHNFPLLTLVGVIDADLGLSGADLRAAERTFQLVRQVAGRAGRADRPGLALVQTHQPDHPVIRAILAGEDEAFWAEEAAQRQALAMPPFGRLAGIILSGTRLEAVVEAAHRLADAAGPLEAIGAQVWGPAPAPVARIRGRHRMRLLVKAPKGAPLQPALRAWLAPVRLTGDLRLVVDIDPQSFM